MMEAARRAVSEIPGAEFAFERGVAEPVTIWRDTIENTLCRCMDDWLDQEGGCIYDLKTTALGLSDHGIQARIDGNSGAGWTCARLFTCVGWRLSSGTALFCRP